MKKEEIMKPEEQTLSDIFNEKNYINESVIQEAVSKYKGIEFSMTGDLIPVEVVEVAIGDFIKIIRKECEELQEDVRKVKPCFNWKFLVKGEGLDKLAGEKFK